MDVELHDDGSEPSMYDLRVGPKETPRVAIECVGAVNEQFTETWNVGPARGSFQLPISSDWMIGVREDAKLRRVKTGLATLLPELETTRTNPGHVDYGLKRSHRELYEHLEDLGVDSVHCYRSPGTGKVSFVMDGDGGAVDSAGVSLSGWISTFLEDSARADVLAKLLRSDAPEQHVFIAVTLKGAPWSVTSYLMGDLEAAPEAGCQLPNRVTGVWVCHTHNRKGIFWNGTRWQIIRTGD